LFIVKNFYPKPKTPETVSRSALDFGSNFIDDPIPSLQIPDLDRLGKE